MSQKQRTKPKHATNIPGIIHTVSSYSLLHRDKHKLLNITMSAFVSHPKALSDCAFSTASKAPTSRITAFNALHMNNNIGIMDGVIDFTGASNGIPSFLVASEVAAISPTEEIRTFEAVAPDTSILVGFGLVFVLSVIASFVWANEVVPVSRTKLALSKRDGEVKEYLDSLKEASLVSVEGDVDGNETSARNVEIKPNVGDGRDVERWLFSDWLNNNKSTGGGRKKDPALPILKKAKWNSGDNPVLVTAAIMMVGIVIASITERV
jgi:hypothetical protein